MNELPKSARALHAVASAIWGDHWQGALAIECGVAPRSVRRWAGGSAPIPAGIWERLGLFAQVKQSRLQTAAEIAKVEAICAQRD